MAARLDVLKGLGSFSSSSFRLNLNPPALQPPPLQLLYCLGFRVGILSRDLVQSPDLEAEGDLHVRAERHGGFAVPAGTQGLGIACTGA